MKDVTVLYGTEVETMTPRILESRKPFDTLDAQTKVVIKPNIVVSRKQWKGVNTDPRIIERLVIALQEQGIRSITIADGAGMGNSVSKAFPICGYDKLAKKYGLNLVDLEKDSFVKKKPSLPGPFSSLDIARTITECDYLINVPVMKAHSQTQITCSLKNLKGTMPRKLKTAFHGTDIDAAIAQLNSIVRPDFTLVDGTYGDLTNEIGYNPVEIGMMLAGADPLAVDCVVVQSLGFEPTDIKHIADSLDIPGRTIDPNGVTVEYLNSPKSERTLTVDTHQEDRYPCKVTADGVCCTCHSNLLFALQRLQEQGRLHRSQHFVIGKKGSVSGDSGTRVIAVGDCAADRIETNTVVRGCPVVSKNIVNTV